MRSSEFAKQDVVELYKNLVKVGIKVWIDGGWGVDALLGKQTRAHEDIDLVVQKKDVLKLRKLLEEQGYRDIKRDDTRAWNFVLGDSKGRLVDVHVIVFDKDGNGIYGPAKNGEIYPADSLSAKGKIGGIKINCVAPEYQVESHKGYKLAKKDHQDIEALRKKFSIDR